jgi:hypothetical protein
MNKGSTNLYFKVLKFLNKTLRDLIFERFIN